MFIEKQTQSNHPKQQGQMKLNSLSETKQQDKRYSKRRATPSQCVKTRFASVSSPQLDPIEPPTKQYIYNTIRSRRKSGAIVLAAIVVVPCSNTGCERAEMKSASESSRKWRLVGGRRRILRVEREPTHHDFLSRLVE